MLSPRLRRSTLALVCGLGLAFAVFKGKRLWEGEALARSLQGPVRSLCYAYHPEELGGCYTDCQTRLVVKDAQASLRAARGFAAIPTHANPAIEARLARVRAASAAVTAALTATCSFNMEAHAPISPEIERCVATVRETRRMGPLMDAVDDLAAFAGAWSGAEFGSMKTCPQE